MIFSTERSTPNDDGLCQTREENLPSPSFSKRGKLLGAMDGRLALFSPFEKGGPRGIFFGDEKRVSTIE
jgi:hypothetical protein